ncbi:MAG: hypothetical protein R3C19_22215 [Planctomycetaceae bacterium]
MFCSKSAAFPLPMMAALVLLTGCGEQPPTGDAAPIRSAAVDSEKAPNTVPGDIAADDSPQTSPGGSQRSTYAGMRFEIPAGWKEVELSAMQRGIIAARFTMPEISQDLTLTLSRSGGSISENLDRWRGQVEASEPERSETVKVAGAEASLIDLKGRFSAGFGREPADGFRMIGVIVPMEPEPYFIKLTGPVDAVAEIEEPFQQFLESARAE